MISDLYARALPRRRSHRSITMSTSSLFPVAQLECGFSTTHSKLDNERISQVDLSDSALGVHKATAQLSHKIVRPPMHGNQSPHAAWEALFPEGSINPSGSIPGGFGFYLNGGTEFAKRLDSAVEALFSYRVMFEQDWEWVKGGKLPSAASSLLCSGLPANLTIVQANSPECASEALLLLSFP